MLYKCRLMLLLSGQNRDIAQVCHAKLVRVTIFQDLTWNKHVENIVEKAGK